MSSLMDLEPILRSSNVGSIYHKPATDLHALHVNLVNSHDEAMW